MSAISPKIGYKRVTEAAAATLKTGPSGFFGYTVTGSTAATITVYDSVDNTGAILFTKTALAVGDVVHFGGMGIAMTKGIHVVIGGTGSVNVLFN